jgi:hypothetical protein
MAKFWITGEKKRLCEETGVSPQMLSDILARRRRVSIDRAKVLFWGSAMVLGPDRAIPWQVWIDPLAEHEAFREAQG